jgi:hypothetical protein
MDNKKILKGVGIFCILASGIYLGVSLGLGKGLSLSLAGFGALAVGLILMALSTQSKGKK